jgi:hypothetical protein
MAPDPRLSPAFRDLLERNRDALNARFAARAKGERTAAMLAFLARTVDPLVAAAPEGKAPAVLSALFDLGLAGIGSGVVGEVDPSPFERALVETAARFGPHWLDDPARFLVATGNAFVRVARELGPDPARAWLEGLAGVAPITRDRAALLDAGLVLAWRAGIAALRPSAIAKLASLEPSIVRAIFGADAVDASPERRFASPASATPLGPLELVAQVGGFVGFGGPFARPPRVAFAGGRMLASDGSVGGEIFADAFGAELVPSAWASEAFALGAQGEPCEADASGRVRWRDAEMSSPLLRGAASIAAGAGMVAVALEDSHCVFVLGRREARA